MAEARVATTRCCASFERFTREVDFLLEDSLEAEATPQPLVANVAPEGSSAGIAPWATGYLPPSFMEFDDLVTVTVWEANLDDWLGRTKPFMNARARRQESGSTCWLDGLARANRRARRK